LPSSIFIFKKEGLKLRSAASRIEHKKEKKIDTAAYTINKAIVVLKVGTKLLNYSLMFLIIFIKFKMFYKASSLYFIKNQRNKRALKPA
tara:strand:- start:40797 stop:41063 length:267 start_codon:yes stop_codon:yes gene_type:complete